MSKELYVGISGKARRVTEMYVGVGGVARKVKCAFIGDENGKASLFYGFPQNPGVITPDNMTADDAPPPYRAASRSRIGAAEAAWHAFSEPAAHATSLSGGVQEGSDIPTGGEWWVEVDLGDPKYANRVRVKGEDMTGGRRGTVDFQILGTNDASAWGDDITSSKWAVVGSVTGYVVPPGQNPFFWGDYAVLNSPALYRYYRMKVTRVDSVADNANCYVCVKQLELSLV
jgi:hypothetical protein